MRTITKLFIILQILDYATTFVGLVCLKGMWEANPMANVWGWETLLLVKLAVCIAVCAFLELRSKSNAGEVFIMFIPVVVVLWNITEIVIKLTE